jgi:O-phospho-L-seryl-tRNASec:L-selenocysteinyl-tRNA synthase
MGHVMTLLTLKKDRPDAKYVIWPRIDQKTCLKAIATSGSTRRAQKCVQITLCSGLVPIVVENLLEGDECRTNVPEIEAQIEKYVLLLIQLEQSLFLYVSSIDSHCNWVLMV